MTEKSCQIISEHRRWTRDLDLGVRASIGPGVKGGFSPKKAPSPVPRGSELLSLGHTTQVLRVLKTTLL